MCLSRAKDSQRSHRHTHTHTHGRPATIGQVSEQVGCVFAAVATAADAMKACSKVYLRSSRLRIRGIPYNPIR